MKNLICLLILLSFSYFSHAILKSKCKINYGVRPLSDYKYLRFNGGGIYFWWQAGASRYLQEKNELIKSIPVYGTSAGAISATLWISNASYVDAAKIAIDIAERNKVWDSKLGLAGIWSPMIKEFLHEIVPNDLSEDDLSRVNIAVTPRLLIKGTKYLNGFTDKDDLINAAMSSVHIPVFMNGKVYSKYKDKQYIDGSFWTFATGRKEKIPLSTKTYPEKEILEVDYNNDEDFMKTLKDSSIVKLITPDGLYEMMDYGYNFMKKKYS